MKFLLHPMMRLLVIVVLLFALHAIVLAQTEEPSAAQAPEAIEYTVSDDGTIISAEASAPLAVQDDCVIGLILVGPKNDAGWSQAHFEAATAVSEAEGCELITFESLNPADSPGTTMMDVATQMVEAGADMIIATSDAFEEDSNTVAAAFPQVALLNMTGSNRLNGNAPDNLANTNSMFEASRYVAGCAAALKAYNLIAPLEGDEQLKIGFVGPLINFETRRHQSSSYLGARHCAEALGVDPDTQLDFEVTWIGFWFNIPGVTLDPTEVSNQFFDQGFQVVISGIDTTEPLQVAGTRRGEGDDVYAVATDNVHACEVAAEACLGEQFYDWTNTYTDNIQALKAGTWTADWELRAPIWAGFTDPTPGATTVGFDFGNLTDDEKAFLTDVITDLGAEAQANPGMIPGWMGPLNLQDGTALTADAAMVNPFAVWYLPQLLEGMVGASSSQ